MDIVEALDCTAAFVAVVDFLYVVLEALELLNVAFDDENVVAVNAELAAADNLALLHITASNVADSRDLEGLADFALAEVYLLVLWRKHALEGGLDIVEKVVDYAVEPYVNIAALGSGLGLCIGTDVEAEDYCV